MKHSVVASSIRLACANIDATQVRQGFALSVEFENNAGGICTALGGTSTVKYVFMDHQGSARALLNGSGAVLARHDYLPFGEELWAGTGMRTTAQQYGAMDQSRDRYALTEKDEGTGLDHTWFRKYENAAGRWTSPDPLGGSIGNPQSLNRYTYVQNDPTNLSDPSGLLGAAGGACYIDGMPVSCSMAFAMVNAGAGTVAGGPGLYLDGRVLVINHEPTFDGARLWQSLVFFFDPQEPAQPQRDPACTRVNALFDESGQGYYTYGPQNQRYGQPGMVAALQNFASGWNQDHPNNPIGVGDLSQFGGAPNWARHPGGGHAGGVIVDIRPMRNDNVRGPTNFNDRTYSHDLTNSLVQGLLGLPEVVSVRFNDPNIQGTVRDARGHVHDNHLHVTFRDAIGCP